MAEIWPQHAHFLVPVYDQVVNEGSAMKFDDVAFDMDRNGFCEVVYVTFTMIPLPRESNNFILYDTLKITLYE